jgi:hypothetical protein
MRDSASQGALVKAVGAEQGLITEEGYKVQAESYKNMGEAARIAADAEDDAADGFVCRGRRPRRGGRRLVLYIGGGMANIREFSAPSDLGLRPDSRADESLANSGRRIAALYNRPRGDHETGKRLVNAGMDVGNVAQKFMEHQEISKGAAEAATTLSNLDQRWNDTVKKADPERPDGGRQIPRGGGRADAAEDGRRPITEGGQKFAEAQVERFRNHFVSKTSADMARLAGVAVQGRTSRR